MITIENPERRRMPDETTLQRHLDAAREELAAIDRVGRRADHLRGRIAAYQEMIDDQRGASRRAAASKADEATVRDLRRIARSYDASQRFLNLADRLERHTAKEGGT